MNADPTCLLIYAGIALFLVRMWQNYQQTGHPFQYLDDSHQRYWRARRQRVQRERDDIAREIERVEQMRRRL